MPALALDAVHPEDLDHIIGLPKNSKSKTLPDFAQKTLFSEQMKRKRYKIFVNI
jgi:hypothetical protein